MTLALATGVAVSLGAQEKKAATSGKQTETVTFKVSLHCAGCQANLEKHLPFEKGVKDMKTDLAKKTVQITYDSGKTDEAKLQAAIEKLGFKVQRSNSPKK